MASSQRLRGPCLVREPCPDRGTRVPGPSWFPRTPCKGQLLMVCPCLEPSHTLAAKGLSDISPLPSGYLWPTQGSRIYLPLGLAHQHPQTLLPLLTQWADLLSSSSQNYKDLCLQRNNRCLVPGSVGVQNQSPLTRRAIDGGPVRGQ